MAGLDGTLQRIAVILKMLRSHLNPWKKIKVSFHVSSQTVKILQDSSNFKKYFTAKTGNAICLPKFGPAVWAACKTRREVGTCH